MAVNVGKTKFMLFHTKGKYIDPNTFLVFDDSKPNQNNPESIHSIKRYHSNHPVKQNRAYKLLGVYFDEKLTSDHLTQNIISKLNRCYTVKKRLSNQICAQISVLHTHSLLSNISPINTSCASTQNIRKISTSTRRQLESSHLTTVMLILTTN
jgi:hypothetical protein